MEHLTSFLVLRNRRLRSPFFLREICKVYYEEQLSSVGRAADFGLRVVGSNPILFLFVFTILER